MNGTKVIWVLTLCSFALGCSQQFIMGIPSVIADSCGVGIPEIGQLMTAFSISGAIGAPIVLAYTSRMAQRNQMLIGLALLTMGMLAFAFSSNYPFFMFMRVVMGLGAGLYNATAMALATQLAPPGKQASALANMGLGSSAAQIIAMPLARTASAFMDWHIFYLLLSIYILVSCILIAKVAPAVRSAADMDTSLRSRLAPLGNPLVLLALLVMVMLNVGYSSYYTYVTPFLEGTFGESSSQVSLLLLVSAFMSAVGIKGSGWLTDHYGYRITVVLALALQVVTLGCLAALHADPVFVWIFMCLWVMADWSFNPSQNLLISRLAGSGAPMALALSGSSLQLGNALGAAIGGAWISVFPVSTLPFVSATACVITLFMEVLLLTKVPAQLKNYGKAYERRMAAQNKKEAPSE